jgi:hypothetical protein
MYAGKRPLGITAFEGRMALNCVLKKYGVKRGSGLNWLWMGSSGTVCEHGNYVV